LGGGRGAFILGGGAKTGGKNPRPGLFHKPFFVKIGGGGTKALFDVAPVGGAPPDRGR